MSNRQGSFSKRIPGSIRWESPYYGGNSSRRTLVVRSLPTVDMPDNDTTQNSDLSLLSSTENLSSQLFKSHLDKRGLTTARQDPHYTETGSVQIPEVPNRTEGQESTGDKTEREKAGFNESISVKLPFSDSVPGTCESQCSFTDSMISLPSAVLLPTSDYDSSSTMIENHEMGSQSQLFGSRFSEAASDLDSMPETTDDIATPGEHTHNKRNPTRATEKKDLTNNSSAPSAAMENEHSIDFQAASKLGLRYISLPHSAALFYNQKSLQSEANLMCDSIRRLNKYLQVSRVNVEAGVPGKFLRVVLGKESSDLGSVVSAITYAYYLEARDKFNELCTVPVINMKRTDLPLHTEVVWLFESCCIDQDSLIFIDEINLPYYNRFGGLKLVLADYHRLAPYQESYKEAVVEILDCKQVKYVYPWASTVIIEQVGSCCTLVAENFALTTPKTLAGHGLSRLLLAGILLDTANLSSPQCRAKDKCMATLLIKGAGQFGRNGIFQLLKHKKFDISDLKIRDILRKDFKEWVLRPGKRDGYGFKGEMECVRMSSVGMSLGELLSREVAAIEEIIHFRKTEKLHLLVIVTGYYDSLRNFKRELVIAGEHVDLVNNLVHFFDTNTSQLRLSSIYQPGFSDDMKAFNIDEKIVSRKSIELLLEDFSLM